MSTRMLARFFSSDHQNTLKRRQIKQGIGEYRKYRSILCLKPFLRKLVWKRWSLFFMLSWLLWNCLTPSHRFLGWDHIAVLLLRCPSSSLKGFQLKLPLIPTPQNVFSHRILPTHLLISMQKPNKMLSTRIQQHTKEITHQGQVGFILEVQR